MTEKNKNRQLLVTLQNDRSSSQDNFNKDFILGVDRRLVTVTRQDGQKDARRYLRVSIRFPFIHLVSESTDEDIDTTVLANLCHHGQINSQLTSVDEREILLVHSLKDLSATLLQR